MVKLLLLWDIDGTLIDSGGAGEHALKVALQTEFGIADDLTWLDYFGRTDTWIARTILQHHQLPSDAGAIARFVSAYLAALKPSLHNPRARVLPGVHTILEKAGNEPAIAQGLLTGNMEQGARIKLGHFDLWRHFPFGAFADDSEFRNDLGPHALRRASGHHAIDFTADRVVVIGDTPHDIECGRAIGARTIAVATGRHALTALRQHQPTAVFENLTDTAAFWTQLATF